MKKILKIVLIIFICIMILVGTLTIWQWNNIKAFFLSVKYSSEEIDTLYKENEQKIDEILSGFTQGNLHDLTDEEKALLLSGDLTEEEALAIIKESQGSKTDQTNSGEYNDRVYDLVAQIYLLRSKFTGELANLEAEALGVLKNTPKEERTISNKLTYVEHYTGRAVALEQQCDAEMEGIIKEIEAELEKTKSSKALISEIWTLYSSEKEIKKSQLLSKYSKYFK